MSKKKERKMTKNSKKIRKVIYLYKYIYKANKEYAQKNDIKSK